MLHFHDSLNRPKRRVRDVAGPSPAVARVERCVNVTDSLLMARPSGSSASPRLLGSKVRGVSAAAACPNCCAISCVRMCGNKQMDMLSLLLGRSRPGGQVVLKVSSASLVRIVRDRTQTGRQRRGVGKTRCKHGRIIGHAAVVRRSCAGRVVEVFAGRTQRHVARALWQWVDCRRQPSSGSGWRVDLTVGPYWLLAPNG